VKAVAEVFFSGFALLGTASAKADIFGSHVEL